MQHRRSSTAKNKWVNKIISLKKEEQEYVPTVRTESGLMAGQGKEERASQVAT